MKVITPVVAAVGLSLSAAAWAAPLEMQYESVRTGTEHRDLYTLAADETGANMITAGAAGTILSSSDGGASWQQNDFDTRLALLTAEMVGDRQIIAGQDGLILVRQANAAWKKVESGVDARLLGLGMNSDGLAVAVGAFGTVLRSADFGATWEVLELNLPERIEGGYNPHLYDAHVSADGDITVIGEFGLVVRSPDSGENWKIVNTGSESLFSLEIREDGAGFAVGQSGLVLRTSNGGLTWTRLETGVDANLLGAWASGTGQVMVTGFRSMLLSEDNGANWRTIRAGDVTRGWYISARGLTDGKSFVAVGHEGRIIRLTAAGNG